LTFPSVDDCLRRIADLDPEIHAWVEVAPQPPTADGPLRDVPFGVKDIFETAGLATEYGSPLYAGRRGMHDAALVALLRSRGAILLGKTQTTAFASFDPAPTRNPAVPGHTPGGSSAGSAAAVAAGMVPFAIGTQTLGSVIRPASYCQICGFKPTYNLIPFDGALPFAPSLDTVGFFAKTLAEMHWLWTNLGIETVSTIAAPRIAKWDTLPAWWDEIVEATYTVNRYEGARTHEARYRQFGDRMGPRLAALIREGLATPETQYRAALSQIAARRREVFSAFDFILTPAAPGPPPKGLATTGDPRMNAPWTAFGSPVITLPVSEVGQQIAAAPGNDDALLSFALRYSCSSVFIRG
jgi:Asp-tRNA(Asn)/Glu-tRNA(Gln) amidotransferase A subunit family amidase